MIDHLTTERVSDYVDGLLERSEAADVERHVGVCPACARELSRMRALLAAASALPRAIEPPAAAWAGVRASIETRKVATLPGAGARHPRRLTPRWLVAASVLVVLSGAAAIAVIRSANHPSQPATSVLVSTRTAAVVAMMIDRHYMPALNQLAAALSDTGGRSRKAIPAVTRSLVLVDSAIAETRAALIRDPGNRDIADLLAANYEKKLDLLKRASELATEQ
jgi:anti-sigma factor RsiW